MKKTLSDFLSNPTKENFSSLQKEIFEDPNYNPYSSDVNKIQDFYDDDELEKAVEYESINTLLSPRAHLFKSYALREMNMHERAQSEKAFALKILKGISLTGDGTEEKPYIVTRISDERDMLDYFEEEYQGQGLISHEDRTLDLMICQSGRKIYFDITRPFLRLSELMDSDKRNEPDSENDE